MATGGGGGGGATSDGGPAGAPSWRRGLVKWQWVEIAGSSLSTRPVTNPLNNMMESPSSRVDAWNGLAANTDTNRLYLACAGGHADWAGNEVYELDLAVDAPSWRILRDPSPGSSISVGVDYYSDGRPASTHLYYALHFVRARNRIFKLSAGSVWGSGNESNSNVDAFDLATNDWDPAGTFVPGTPHGGAIDRPYAYHPVTDDAFTFFSGSFRRWNAATATWDVLAPRPSYANNDVVQASGSAVDTMRQRVLFARNLYRVAMNQGLSLSFAGTPSLTDVTFTGPAAAEAISAQAALQYLAPEDAFILKSEAGGAVFRVDAASYEVTAQPTSGPNPPDAVNGVYTRWQYLPLLGGFAYLPRGSANVWFIATE